MPQADMQRAFGHVVMDPIKPVVFLEEICHRLVNCFG